MRFVPRQDAPAHPALLAHPNARGLMEVDGLDEPCLVDLRFCREPRCHCQDVKVTLRELTPGGDVCPEGLSIEAWVDPNEGTIATRESIDRAHQILSKQAVEAIPAWMIRDVAMHDLIAKHAAARLAQAHIPHDEIRSGRVQSWVDLATGGQGPRSGGDVFAGTIVHEGAKLLFDLRFCPDPACDCRRVHIEVYRVTPAAPPAREQEARQALMLMWSLDTDELEIAERYHGSPEGIVPAVRAWLDTRPDRRASLEQHRLEVREVAARCLEQAERSPHPRATVRVGRNQACPCGSGKKYKRCCGR